MVENPSITRLVVIAVIVTLMLPVLAVTFRVNTDLSTAHAQTEYSASIRRVAGGPELPEVFLFEDNYTRCYLSDHGMECLKK